MKIIFRLIVVWASAMLALYLAGQFIPGFGVPSTFTALVAPGAVLASLMLVLKPVLKLILLPFVWLTFGLLSFAMNVLFVFVLDKIFDSVTIIGLAPLLLGTLVITITNIICQHLLLPRS